MLKNNALSYAVFALETSIVYYTCHLFCQVLYKKFHETRTVLNRNEDEFWRLSHKFFSNLDTHFQLE